MSESAHCADARDVACWEGENGFWCGRSPGNRGSELLVTGGDDHYLPMNTYNLRAETEPDLGPVARLNRILPWIIGLAVLGLVLVRYLPQIHKNEEMRRQLQQKSEEVQRLEAEVSRLRIENNALARDSRTIERTAREQLSLARPDEHVVTFQDAPINSTGAGAPLERDGNRRPNPPAPAPAPTPGNDRGPN